MVSSPTLSETGRRAVDAVVADPAHTLLAFDFDGTIAPIVDDPEHAYALPESVAALRRLGPVVAKLAIVTGRPARTAVRLGGFGDDSGLASLSVLGQYGVERWDADDGEFHDPPAPEAIAGLETRLESLLEREAPQARIEHKGRALAVHTRGLPDADEAVRTLLPRVTELADALGLAVEPGKHVIEVRAAGFDKGDAVRRLVAESGATTVVFAGDDLGDLAAFEAVTSLRAEGVIEGLLICSASDEQDALCDHADLVLDGPLAVAGWLADLADRLGA